MSKPTPRLAVHHSSRTGEWATPWALFRELDREFGFTLDVCATAENAKVARFYSPEDDGLLQPWEGRIWCNPPYGRRIGAWFQRARDAQREGHTVVMLVPARTDTAYWHQHVWDARRHRPREGVQIRFLPGRIRFGDTAGDAAPFPSAIVVFRPIHNWED